MECKYNAFLDCIGGCLCNLAGRPAGGAVTYWLQLAYPNIAEVENRAELEKMCSHPLQWRRGSIWSCKISFKDLHTVWPHVERIKITHVVKYLFQGNLQQLDRIWILLQIAPENCSPTAKRAKMGSRKKQGIKVLPCQPPQMGCCYKQACSKRQLKGLGRAPLCARVLTHILNFTQLGTLLVYTRLGR